MGKLEIVVLAFGPTQSGKTTTLTKLQEFLDELGFKVARIEDNPSFNLPQVRIEGFLAERPA